MFVLSSCSLNQTNLKRLTKAARVKPYILFISGTHALEKKASKKIT